MSSFLKQHSRWIGVIVSLGLLAIIIYRPTLQTIPNGSSDLMMIDVGETQVVLNTWGTLHATGYPFYVMLGNIQVILLRAIGFTAVTAPALVSLFWGLGALSLLYWFLFELTRRSAIALVVTLLFGLTRFVWLYNVVAEIYSFALLMIVTLYLLALWQPPLKHRISWLALAGGFGIAHHRAILLLVPALLFAVWPLLWQEIRHRPLKIVSWLLLGIVGFLPYFYLPLRDWMDATWVYAEPGTWHGFWDQFFGKESSYLSGWPDSFQRFMDNVHNVNQALVQELSWSGLVIGLLGIIMAIYLPQHRRAGITVLLGMIVAYLFSTLYFFVILATAFTIITVGIAVGWAFAAMMMLEWVSQQKQSTLSAVSYTALTLGAISLGIWLIEQNTDWIKQVTQDRTGLETIAIAENTPPDSTLMVTWGPRYFALGFAQDVENRLPDFRRVDHQGDFAAILAEGKLITPDFTFYTQPVSWWEQHLGQKVYLRAIAPYLIQIDIEPEMLPETLPTPTASDDGEAIIALEYSVQCVGTFKALYVEWAALDVPPRPLSVLVHLLNSEGIQLGEADRFAPVFGWRPVTTWEKGEIVRDIYPFPEVPGVTQLQFGFYEQRPGGAFQNYLVQTVPSNCEETSKS